MSAPRAETAWIKSYCVWSSARTPRVERSELERFLLDVNRNCHGGFPRSRKSDSSALSAAAEGCHGEGLLERFARACSCDGRGGREPAGGCAYAQACPRDNRAVARP